MAWAGLIAIAVYSLLLGAMLYIPARWWVKRRLRNMPEGSLHVTSAGIAAWVLMLAVLIGGLSQRYFAPETEFGQFVASGVGSLAFSFAVYVLGIVLGMVLDMLGFVLVRPPDE